MSYRYTETKEFAVCFGYDNPLKSFWCDLYNHEDLDTPVKQIGLNTFKEHPDLDTFLDIVKDEGVNLDDWRDNLLEDKEKEDVPLTPLQRLVTRMSGHNPDA